MRHLIFRKRRSEEHARPAGFLTRIRRNEAGNTLSILAAGMIPLMGLVGGAVDMSRIYLTKSRLQQACDAGALAGRKVMGPGAWSANSNAANTIALRFFDSNFADGSYGSASLSRSYSESQGKVTGTASVTLPMTLMRVLGQGTRTIAVTCDAEMRIPNTDVMFVLDVTGSMGNTLSGDTITKIAGMKRAVKCFYEILQKLDTTENCPTGTPSGGVGNQVQIRFGFVPYATNVNVGKLLPTSYFASSWNYQSRQAVFNTPHYLVSGTSSQTFYDTYGSSISKSDCRDYGYNDYPWNGSNPVNGGGPAPTATTSTTYSPYSWGGTVNTSGSWGGNGTRTCVRQRVVTTTTYNSTPKYRFSFWRYNNFPINVSNFVAGSAVPIATSLSTSNSYVDVAGAYSIEQLPNVTGATNIGTTSYTWDGCIEERNTVSQSSYDPLPTYAYDLDIDMVPSSLSVYNSYWGPTFKDVVYGRGSTSGTNDGNYILDQVETTTNYGHPSYTCPTAAKKLQSWATASTFESYVNSLSAGGNTYHDIGLLWGARLISSTGIFASENAQTPSGGDIERHLIFMTDGEACTSTTNYQAYGLAWFDRRTTTASSAPTDGCSTDTGGGGTLTEQVVARYTALCEAVKNKNITLWVIYFGNVAADDRTRMDTCSTDGRFYEATNSTTLLQTFATIASQISQLRLTS